MATRSLLSGPITATDAKARSSNILHALQYPSQKDAFYKRIEGHRTLIAEVVAHHLGTKPSDIDISPQDYWRHGSFNLCVPIAVRAHQSAQPKIPEHVFIRFPLPYRVGEAGRPGNSDEKLNCEAATYAWLQENCPSIPIPRLYGFGLSTNRRFTHLELLPWWSRCLQHLRRFVLAALRFQQPSSYVHHSSSRFAALDVGYLIIETITADRGEMLSESWDDHRGCTRLRTNLQRDLSRILISLSRISLPRIGSFRLDCNGYLHLANRPLNVQSIMHENEGLPLDISRDTTFPSVTEFVLSCLTTFDNRLLYQPNSITSREDALDQMSGLAVARSIFPQLFRHDLSNGPFMLSLTDLHKSNIFVDKDWRITCIIDLEFACSLPVEFLESPSCWLDVEMVHEMAPDDFAPKHAEFLEHLRHEEKLQNYQDRESLSSIMEQTWKNGTFWFTLALRDPIAFNQIMYDNILASYFAITANELSKADYSLAALTWRPNISDIIDRKLRDQEKYQKELDQVFEDPT
ncbi:hypothetical protein CCM_07841 [Cordyceps militaris CM01]|uniref:Uncharacterized protein n=2 Tax=Cordyceps militaris TaxID=73501 RepID=G3JNX9_CORMM|nr:uncharacterized protein CCM_07841 [Cordyceps militaris CM01]ATY63678.1 phosphotransferase family [Cordyceps militaris]EGX89589.1 hypothetical protein CCM_07841 [Cordyceps militaris CM01]